MRAGVEATRFIKLIALRGYFFNKLFHGKQGDEDAVWQSLKMAQESLSDDNAKLPRPKSSIEHSLFSCRNNTELDLVLSDPALGSFHDIYYRQPNQSILDSKPFEAAKKAYELLKAGDGKSVLYLFLLGFTLQSHLLIRKYCQTCNWRLINFDNGKNRCCTSCYPSKMDSSSQNEDTPSISTLRRRQITIHKNLKNSDEYQAFMNVRYLGENYILRMAVGKILPSAFSLKAISGDTIDFTDDVEYRARKVALYEIWNSFKVPRKTFTRPSKDEILLELAKSGISKAEAAGKANMKPSGVSKACKRNPALKDAFAKNSES